MAAEFKDYYEQLAVAKDATQAEVKKAFRALARKYHPDVAKDKNTAEARFKEINEAYEVLGDPEKRKKYDLLGASWNQQGGPPPGGGAGYPGGPMPGGAEFEFGGMGFSDFFEQYFAGGGARATAGYGGGYPGGGPMRGRDIEGDIMVTLEEIFSESIRTISLRKIDPKTGHATTHEVQVRIPAGISEGQRLRVPGHGGPGYGGGEPGDLYLRIRIAAHLDFRVKGRDLFLDLALAPWEAVLGTTLAIKTPEGKTVQVKIPPGTGSDDQLRIKGYGLPKKDAPGDLYVVISIATPPNVSDEERSHWEKLRDVSNFNPREH